MSNIEEKIVFGMANTPDGKLVILIGVPNGAWEYMKDGKTNNFDLSRAGVPIQVLVYGGKDHSAVKKVVDDWNAGQGLPSLDLRREDWTIKDKA